MDAEVISKRLDYPNEWMVYSPLAARALAGMVCVELVPW